MNNSFETSKRQSRLSVADQRSVFVSFSFAHRVDFDFDGIIRLLGERGFIVITGELTNGSVGQGVLERIKNSCSFLSIMTRDQREKKDCIYTGPWLLEEKALAIAFNKPIVLMREEGVTASGGLEGDQQKIQFTNKNFLQAALDAVKQLELAFAERIRKQA
jgi:hypothetical protein